MALSRCALYLAQVDMVAALRAAIGPTKKLVAVLIHGGTMAFPNATLDALDAVLDAWYPGLGGGEAIAATLFGDQSPAGRTSQTWYSSTADLPDQSKGYMVSMRMQATFLHLLQHAATHSI